MRGLSECWGMVAILGRGRGVVWWNRAVGHGRAGGSVLGWLGVWGLWQSRAGARSYRWFGLGVRRLSPGARLAHADSGASLRLLIHFFVTWISLGLEIKGF